MSLLPPIPLNIHQLKRLDITLKPIPISEPLAMPPSGFTPPDLSNYPGVKPYATVIVGGKVVATIDNQGCVTSSNELGAKLRDQLPDNVNGTNGPNLAQVRAEKIADMLGGKVVKADTAITQSQFSALSPPEPQKTMMHSTTTRDDLMREELLKIKQARTLFLAQQIGSATFDH